MESVGDHGISSQGALKTRRDLDVCEWMSKQAGLLQSQNPSQVELSRVHHWVKFGCDKNLGDLARFEFSPPNKTD